MASIIVKEVSSKRDWKNFIRFSNKLYKGHPYFVPKLYSDDEATLDPRKNAAYDFCESQLYLAYKDDIIVGRIAAIINHKANKTWNVRQLRFGWVDFIEDIKVLEALIDAATAWGKARGMTQIAGPLGFADFDPEGMLVEGFDQLSTMITIYNHPYYPEYFEKLGFTKEVDWIEYLIKLPESVPERYTEMAKMIMEQNHLKVKKLTRSIIRKENYGQKIFDLINEAYAPLYGYSHLSERQIDQYVKQYLGFVDLRMVTCIEDENGELIAAGITIPNLSKALQKTGGKLFPFGWYHLLKGLYFKRSDTLDLLLIGIRTSYQRRGINSIIFADMIPNLLKMGFKYAEGDPQLETNKKVHALWKAFATKNHKRRRVYRKEI